MELNGVGQSVVTSSERNTHTHTHTQQVERTNDYNDRRILAKVVTLV